jgi:hypothetical protein
VAVAAFGGWRVDGCELAASLTSVCLKRLVASQQHTNAHQRAICKNRRVWTAI